MRLSVCIDGIREKVNDAANKQWSDARIAYWISRKQQSIYNELLQADPTYKQMRVSLLSSSATQVHTNTWRYLLPSWCHRINMVHESSAAGSARTRPIPPISDDEFHRYGWCFDGDRAIELRGCGSPKDLTLWVSKPPAPVMAGALSNATGLLSRSVLPILATPAPVDSDGVSYEQPSLVQDAYVNSIIEVTQPLQANLAVPVRISGSVVSVTELLFTVEPELPVISLAGHLFEMHVEVDDQYMEYLMLDVAMTLFQKTRNSEGIASLMPEMRVERAKFLNAIQPRQVQEPYRVRPEGGFDYGPYEDANRDWQW